MDDKKLTNHTDKVRLYS